MERNLLLTVIGILMGVAVAALWWPIKEPKPPPDREVVIETPSYFYDPVPFGQRGVLFNSDFTPAIGVDVYLTEFRYDDHIIRYWPAVRTNISGHFRMNVPPGLYRVQALKGFDQQADLFVTVGTTHPDTLVFLHTVSLFHFVASH